MTLKRKLYLINTILYFVLSLPTIIASNDKCTAYNGVCMDNAIEVCKGNYTYTKNKCDGDESIKCCIPVITCNTPDSTGVCINEKQCDTNTSEPVRNYCPDLPDDIKCCVPKSNNSNNSNKVNKVMDVDTFIEKLKDIEENYKTRYVLGGVGQPLNEKNRINFANDKYNYKDKFGRLRHWRNAILNATDDSFAFDCSGLIKSILWGWNGDRNEYRGGAIAKSNNVPDATADQLCSNTYSSSNSKDFNKIDIGEIVCQDGHIGVYVGNNTVIESAPRRFDESKVTGVQKSNLKDRKDVYGVNRGQWKFHMHLNFIDYCNCANQASISSEKDTENDEFCNCNDTNSGNTIETVSDNTSETISDNNLNTSGFSYINHFSFLSIFIILTSIFIWQTHIIF